MRMTNNTVAIVIPALNEEEALSHLLSEISSEIADWVIVVDNNSTDTTAMVARNAGAVVVGEMQRGYGRACWRGFQKALELDADIVVFMDGDGCDNPVDLPAMLTPLFEDRADMTMGSRISNTSEYGAVPPQSRLGNWMISRLLNIMYGMHIHDIGSFRAIRCSALERLRMREMTFGWPVEMLVKSGHAHYRVLEIPLHYRRRTYGHSKIAGTVVGSVKAAYVMLRTMARYARKRDWQYV
jgi:glycosyltransferase involved in cell wall biosynthesis